MSPHQFIASVAFAACVVTAACASNPPPPSSPGVTSAQRVETSTAVSRLVDAQCRHADACNEIGGNRTYATKDACLSEARGKAENNLRTADCPRGVDSTRLNACITEIKAEACSGVGSGFSRSMACGTGTLCP
jgi:hypothetical protein